MRTLPNDCTECINDECPLRHKCLRNRASGRVPEGRIHSPLALFDGADESGECDYFWEIDDG